MILLKFLGNNDFENWQSAMKIVVLFGGTLTFDLAEEEGKVQI